MVLPRLQFLLFACLIQAFGLPVAHAQVNIILPLEKQSLISVSVQESLVGSLMDSQYRYDIISDARGQVLGLESREEDQNHRLLQRFIPRSLKELKRGTHLLKVGNTVVVGIRAESLASNRFRIQLRFLKNAFTKEYGAFSFEVVRAGRKWAAVLGKRPIGRIEVVPGVTGIAAMEAK